MISHPAFTVEPWSVRETELHLDVLAQTESVFALSNGNLGLRGNLDEGEPAVLPGTYLSAFYELRPLPYPESGFGYPEASQSVVNIANGKVIRLLVDDETFDVRYGELHHHERVLDLRAGTLHREVEWSSPVGRRIRLRTTRLVSFVQRAIAAVVYEVEPVEDATRFVVMSDLVANEPMPAHSGDPRSAAALQAPLRQETANCSGTRIGMAFVSKASGLQLVAGMDHLIDGPPGTEVTSETLENLGRVVVTAKAHPGERLGIVKFLAYGYSGKRSGASVRAQVIGSLAEARQTGWDGLAASQREYLDDFWDRSDIEIEGDAEVQQAVRFALFHILQAGARSERRAIAAKGLTGPGYDGHAFWDTESFVLPVLTYTLPDAAASALRWRHSTLGLARERARLLGLNGAAFPWRTIDGQECSGYWPASTAAVHINADVADAVIRYQSAVSDPNFEKEVGLELLVETARFWRSFGHHDAQGAFRIDGVTGPDEYSAVADNNVYTNLMAQRNLLAAAGTAEAHPEQAAALGVDPEELAEWRDAAAAMKIPYDEDLGVHPQSEGFTSYQRWDFASQGDRYPLMMYAPYLQLYRKQVVKQADLVMALHLRGDAFTPEEKARDFAYYEQLTVRDSSLSASTQAVMAAEVGFVELAYRYFGEAALMDLLDYENNTSDGIHIASLGGAWIAAVAGFGGMRDHDATLSFSPRLPQAITRLCFNLVYQGRRIRVEVGDHNVTYSLQDGEPLDITHHGRAVKLGADAPVSEEIPDISAPDEPHQPPGRAPHPRRRI